METINELAVYTYSLIGAVFIFFSILILTLTRINNSLRLSVAGLFLATGFYFFNSAGKILTNYDIGFMKSSLVNACILTVLASVLVYVVYKLNREKIEHQRDLEK